MTLFNTSQEGKLGFPGGTSGKESTYQAGDARDVGSIPGSGRSPGGGNGNPLQYSSRRIPLTEEASGPQATESQESDTTEGLSHVTTSHVLNRRDLIFCNSS